MMAIVAEQHVLRHMFVLLGQEELAELLQFLCTCTNEFGDVVTIDSHWLISPAGETPEAYDESFGSKV